MVLITEVFCCCNTFKLPSMVKSPPIETSPPTSKRPFIEESLITINFVLVFNDKSPAAVILIRSEAAVKNCNSSLSAPGEDSATTLVSWSTSITPPNPTQVVE